MAEFREHFVKCCGYEVHVRAWGNPSRRPLIMMHGLARLADDFDHVAPISPISTMFCVRP